MLGRYRFAPLLFVVLGCRSPTSEVEPGAVLLHVKVPDRQAQPDFLRVSAYDNRGVLWNAERVPKQGSLNAAGKQDLGTVLLQPGHLQGDLRVYVAGMRDETRVSDGALRIKSLGSGKRILDIVLSAQLQADGDGDGVPDGIDDCSDVANPAQMGCPAALTDASVQGPDVADAKSGDTASDSLVLKDDGPVPTDDADRDRDLRDPSDGDAGSVASKDVREDGNTQDDLPVVGDVADSRDADALADIADVADTALPDLATDPVDRKDLPADVPTCDLAGGCNKAQGSICTADGECVSGHCADGVCCTNSCVGLCRSCNQPGSVGVCQGYADGTDPESECGTGAVCNGAGACGVKQTNLPNGQLCSTGSQCASKVCKDGVCCNNACNSPCQTCGSGTCTTVKRADDIPECTGTMTCNGVGACVGR